MVPIHGNISEVDSRNSVNERESEIVARNSFDERKEKTSISMTLSRVSDS